jgi:quercetin dioxygenase-like cupin family protein
MQRRPRLLATAAVAAGLVIGGAGIASATPISGASVDPITRGTISRTHQHARDFKLFQKYTRDFVIVSFTLDKGGTLGWHSHPGPALIKVKSGTLTIEHANCTFSKYGPGTAEVETMRQVHNAFNKGDDPVTGYAVYLNVPVGGATRIDEKAPACDR